MRVSRLALALSLLASTAYAQQVPGYGPQGTPAPKFHQVITAAGTYNLPAGYTHVHLRYVGGGGGPGCGIVVTSGTASSGGASGGTGFMWDFNDITSDQLSNSTTITVSSVGTAGTKCTASGTTNGSSGSAATAGGNTAFTIGSLTFPTAFGGGAGANGQSGAAAGGGATGAPNAAGASGSGSTNGVGGTGALSGAAGCSTTLNLAGCGGQPGVSGAAGAIPLSRVIFEMHTSGAAGSGLAATPVSIAGATGVTQHLPGDATSAGGAASCSGTSQNALAGTYGGVGLHGVSGGGGASCTASAGGNGGDCVGYGATGGGGGSTLPTFTAGSGGASCPGAILVEAW